MDTANNRLEVERIRGRMDQKIYTLEDMRILLRICDEQVIELEGLREHMNNLYELSEETRIGH